MSSTIHSDAWGELREMLSRPPIDFIEVYHTLGRMREVERAAGAHYVRSHTPRWEPGWFHRLYEIDGLDEALDVWAFRLIVATGWRMSLELDVPPPHLFTSDIELKLLWREGGVSDDGLDRRQTALAGDTGARQYHAHHGGATYRLLANDFLEQDARRCVSLLHDRVARMGTIEQWIRQISERGVDAIDRATTRFGRTVDEVVREKNPLRGGSHLLSWATREAARATSSLMNFGPSVAQGFDDSGRAREERRAELEAQLMQHLLDTMELPYHLDRYEVRTR